MMEIDVLFNRPNRPLAVHDLIEEIHIAKYRVVLASAWFTDVGIAQAVIDSHAETKIVILNRSDLRRGEAKAYQRLADNPYLKSGRHGSGLFVLGGMTWEQGVMHHKFCLLDYRVVWTGSFNFTMHARRNYETLMRIDNMEVNEAFWDEALALVGEAPSQDPMLPVDGDFCRGCHRPVTPEEVCGWNSDGDVWCDHCMTPPEDR